MNSFIFVPSSSVYKPTFLSELSNLNTSVNEWIGKHVRENPYVDLTPIFRWSATYDALCHNHVHVYTSYLCVCRHLSPSLYICRDYEKHLKELDRKFQTEQSTTSERVGMGSEVDIITRSDSSVAGERKL